MKMGWLPPEVSTEMLDRKMPFFTRSEAMAL